MPAPRSWQVQEVNTGIYCFENAALFSALAEITCDNAQGEYYLTDVIGILVNRGSRRVGRNRWRLPGNIRH